MLTLAGGFLFLMQLHGHQHSAFADEFPLNKDDHSHVHEDLLATEKPAALEAYQKPIILTAPGKNTAQPSPTKKAAHNHGDGTLHTH